MGRIMNEQEKGDRLQSCGAHTENGQGRHSLSCLEQPGDVKWREKQADSLQR
jgi:hypothetical protein